ncbi:cell division protein FtsZ [Dongia deserti]|uniref:cell division protein FtsZ n=1 Tax=Dongia deserti TaxID=2268030 RepID=UPI000E64D7FA|nr:cell division protein FtsZ [Dongia deserti]
MTLNLSLPQDPFDIRPKITVVGVGGAGGNAVNNMIRSKLEGVDFLVANTDAQALQQSQCERRIQLGSTVTKGLGAGARPDVGRMAAEEAVRDIAEQLAGSNMVFITAGMGGGTGTGAGPVVAQIAREQGILTVGVVTKPFHFEGSHRMRMAESGITELQSYVDTLIIIPNQNLFRIANEKTTFADAFKMADEVLYSGVRGVTDLMVMPGLINLDFADIRAVMSEMGKAMMGTGEASGDNRAIAAAEAAISNPLLDEISMKGARGVLINITGGMDMTLFEVDEAANRIRDEVDPDANIIFGSTFDQTLEGRIRISVVATGIDAQAVTQPRPGANLSLVPRTVPVMTQPGGDVGDRAVARTETGFTPAAASPMAAHAVAPQARPAAGFGMVTTPKVAQPTMSTGQQQPMTHPTMGATALQAQPARQPILKDEMAALDRLIARPVARVERPIDDKPFMAPPASEPATRMQPQVAEPVVPQARAPQPESAPAPQAAAPAQASSMQMPSPQAPAVQPPNLTVDPPHAEQRRRAPSLFEKVTSRLTGQPTPKAPPAPQAPRPQAERQSDRRAEPVLSQPQLQLDPADRMSLSRQEEDMLDIPAFLRRQAN